ncbi:aminotransferase class V-fold PLP-dependent enzyme [Streptomyces chartreusis]|uniref:aminotransferase class V-fold PLP-dependent enzyme n=1 Tax=Streptomyces chartreusis TaxID=1969 RepID=UPI003814408A
MDSHISISADGALSRRVHDEFPKLIENTYLDSACIGIAPRRSVEAVSAFLRQVDECPEGSGTSRHSRLNELRAAARPLAARLIGAAPEDIAIVESTTHGLTIAAQSLPLSPGDMVAISDLEFIQMGVAWSQLESRGVRIQPIRHVEGTLSVDRIRESLHSRVRVLALSSVQWTNGFRADLAAISAICEERGIWLVVDAAQHLGALRMNVSQTPVDMLVCGGHKWLNSPFGAGVLYISPKVRERLNRPVAGFFSAKFPMGDSSWGESFLRRDTSPFREYEFSSNARTWEIGGTSNFPGGIALSASLSLILEIGSAVVEERIFALTEHLFDGLSRTPFTIVSNRAMRHRSGIVTLTTGNGAADVALMNHLLSIGVPVSVRYTSGVGGVRVSCHYYNTYGDVDRLLNGVTSWADHEGWTS